jgi:hypothetical protein
LAEAECHQRALKEVMDFAMVQPILRAQSRLCLRHGRSMTPEQNSAHHTITGCKASRNA